MGFATRQSVGENITIVLSSGRVPGQNHIRKPGVGGSELDGEFWYLTGAEF